jgi:hypothetical protein
MDIPHDKAPLQIGVVEIMPIGRQVQFSLGKLANGQHEPQLLPEYSRGTGIVEKRFDRLLSGANLGLPDNGLPIVPHGLTTHEVRDENQQADGQGNVAADHRQCTSAAGFSGQCCQIRPIFLSAGSHVKNDPSEEGVFAPERQLHVRHVYPFSRIKGVCDVHQPRLRAE